MCVFGAQEGKKERRHEDGLEIFKKKRKFLGLSCLLGEEQYKHPLKQGQCHVDPSRPTVFTFKEKCRTLAQNF